MARDGAQDGSPRSPIVTGTGEPGVSPGQRSAGALVQSVDRALTVLEILAQRGVAGVTEIAGELGVHTSTASRLVAVLESRGFVEQLTERGKYRLGPASPGSRAP